jgi:hypothetical protein
MQPQSSNQLKYCEKTTTNHPFVVRYKKCLSAIKTLLEAEGIKKCPCPFHEKHAVLNLDKAEIARKSHPRSPTCDFIFGISTAEKNRKMVLVECKFNLGEKKVFESNFRTDILNKIRYSKLLVGTELPFFENNIVLMEDKLYHQSKHAFYQLFRECKVTVVSSTVSLFYDNFFV